jgi:hypothetical protein
MTRRLVCLQDEMDHRYRLSQYSFVSLASRHVNMLKDFSFFLAVVINLLLLLAYGVSSDTVPGLTCVSVCLQRHVRAW